MYRGVNWSGVVGEVLLSDSILGSCVVMFTASMTIATALPLVTVSPNQQLYSCCQYHTCFLPPPPMGLDKMKSQLQSTARSNTMVGTDSDTAVVIPALQNNFYKYILEMPRNSPKARSFWARITGV